MRASPSRAALQYLPQNPDHLAACLGIVESVVSASDDELRVCTVEMRTCITNDAIAAGTVVLFAHDAVKWDRDRQTGEREQHRIVRRKHVHGGEV